MEGKRPTNESLLRALDHAHMVYLGLLPTAATFSLLYAYGHPVPFLLFLAGTAAVAVYLAATYSYTPRPPGAGVALFVLLDGPKRAPPPPTSSSSSSPLASLVAGNVLHELSNRP